MLQRTKTKRINQFHKEYEEICADWLVAMQRLNNVVDSSPEYTQLYRTFTEFQSKAFVAALKMLSPVIKVVMM